MTDFNDAAVFNGVAVLQVVDLPPDPRINEAIGLQHSIESALADLIDNSVEHGSARVSVRFVTRSGHLDEILVVDDGNGMDGARLQEALRLGARREYAPGALGGFGVGLKASAFSQAEVLTVMSQASGHEPAAMRSRRSGFDPSLTAEVLDASQARAAYGASGIPLQSDTGTVVSLQGIRMASRSDDLSERSAWLDRVVGRVRGHLGLVFHRFIDAERVRFTVDVFDADSGESGVPFHPAGIDPFRTATGKLGYPRTFLADLPEGVGLPITCHLLAPGAKGTDVAILGQPRADWQGIWVYRNDRLLRFGGWDDVAIKRNELQLARVAVDITADSARWFGLNAEKSGVALLPELVRAIQKSGDEDVSFEGFLNDSRDVLKQSNRRERQIKPVAAMGSGLPADVEAAAGELFGFREYEHSVNVRWMSLQPSRVFLLDHDRRTIWLNERHRDELATGTADDPHAVVKSLLFLLLENYFQPSQLQAVTVQQIEAMQSVVATALGVTTFEASDAEQGDSSEGESEAEGVAEVARPGRHATIRSELEQLEQLDLDDVEADGEEDLDAIEFADEPALDPDKATETDWTTDAVRDYLASIGRHPLLQAHEEVSLARRIEAGVLAEERLEGLSPDLRRGQLRRELAWIARDGVRARDQMASSNLRLVVSLAKRYQHHGLELMDLIQEGNAGLVRAIEKFDYTKGFKFSTYATWWIRQAITRALADKGRAIRMPVHMVEFGHGVDRVGRELARELDRTPTPREIADRLGESQDKIELYLKMSKPLLSLNEERKRGDWDGPDDLEVDEFGSPIVETVEFGNLIEDEFDDVENAIAGQMLGAQIEAVLHELDERSEGVLRMRFGLDGTEPRTLDYIGEAYGVTRERIRQIEGKALKKLRTRRIRNALGLVAPAVAVERPDIEDVGVTIAELIGGGNQHPAASSPSVVHDIPRPGAPDALERAWSADELRILVRSYRQLRHVRQAAAAEGFEDREAAVALTRLLLWESGSIDDSLAAEHHGAPWTPEETASVVEQHLSGVGLREIAERQGRTQLAIAWRLLDSTTQSVDVPDRFSSAKALEKEWADVRRDRENERAEAQVG